MSLKSGVGKAAWLTFAEALPEGSQESARGRVTAPLGCCQVRLLLRLFLRLNLDEAGEPRLQLEITAANREFKSEPTKQHPRLVRVQKNVQPSQGGLRLQFQGLPQKPPFLRISVALCPEVHLSFPITLLLRVPPPSSLSRGPASLYFRLDGHLILPGFPLLELERISELLGL